MFKSLLAVVVLALSIGSAHATAPVDTGPYTLTGGVVVFTMSGSSKFAVSMPYRVPFTSTEDGDTAKTKCNEAIKTVRDSKFIEHGLVQDGWNNASPARLVSLQCVSR